MLDQNQLLSLFDYKDGELYWRIAPCKTVNAGDKAGYINRKYKKIKIKNKSYVIHRIIFMMFHGYMPEIVDHIDNNPLNNCIENLRPATKQQNNSNCKMRIDAKSSAKGVNWHKKQQKWTVRVSVNNKRENVGSFDNFELAELVATMAREKYHGAFARHF